MSMLANYRFPSGVGFARSRQGIGFNRATWQAGSNIGKYVKRNISKYLKSGKSKREAKVDSSRAKSKSKSSSTLFGQQIPVAGGESRSMCVKLLPNKHSAMTRYLAPVTINRANSLTAASSQGLQNLVLIASYFDVPDLTNTFSALSETTVNFNAAYLFIQKIVAKNMITNGSNTNCHATIYDCYAKVDGFTTLNPDPVTVLSAGGVDAQGGAAGDINTLGTIPKNIPRYRELYQTIKITPLILAPGQTHIHNFEYAPNLLFNKERITTNTQGPLRTLTHFSFVIFHGTPMHDTATELVIGVSQTKLDIVRMETCQYKQVQTSQAFNNIGSSVSTTVTAPEQWVINAPTDATNAI